MAHIGKPNNGTEIIDSTATGPRRGQLLKTLALTVKLFIPGTIAVGTAACGNDTSSVDDEAGVTTNMSSTATESTTDDTNDTSSEGSAGMDESGSEGSAGMDESGSEGSAGMDESGSEGSAGMDESGSEGSGTDTGTSSSTDSQGEVGDTTTG